MQGHIAKYVKCCKTCQMSAPLQTEDRAPLEPLVLDAPLMSDLSTDIMVGNLPVTAKGNKYLLGNICNVSKFIHAIPLRNLKAKTMCGIFLFCGFTKRDTLRSNEQFSVRADDSCL